VTAPTTAREAELSARRSATLAWAVRGGLVGYGLLHLLVAWIAVRLVLTPERGAVTGRGALAQLAGTTSGRLTLVVMAAGFAALVVWQLIAAAVGYHDRGTPGRVLERSGALCRAAVWGYLAFTTVELAVSGGSGRSPSATTATVMSWPAGVGVVALVGFVVAGVGIGLAVFGWRVGFLGQLDERARSQDQRRKPIIVLGRIGYVTKGIALVVIGVLLVWAAWSHDPDKSGGLDRALYELVGGRLGTAAIIVVAVGLCCFGLFLVARARHLDRRSLTS
jgi:hypothetical protein